MTDGRNISHSRLDQTLEGPFFKDDDLRLSRCESVGNLFAIKHCKMLALKNLLRPY